MTEYREGSQHGSETTLKLKYPSYCENEDRSTTPPSEKNLSTVIIKLYSRAFRGSKSQGATNIIRLLMAKRHAGFLKPHEEYYAFLESNKNDTSGSYEYLIHSLH